MDPSTALRFLRLLPIALLLAGCVHLAPSPLAVAEDDPVAQCQALFETMDARVRRSGHGDARAQAIDGFPWLRIDRPLASFRSEVGSEQRFEAWLTHLNELDAEARTLEWANLPDHEQQRLSRDWDAVQDSLPGAVLAALAACRETLNDSLRQEAPARDRLLANAVAQDAYVAWQRWLGLYPLLRPMVRNRVEALHQRLLALMEQGPDPDRLQRYVASDAQQSGDGDEAMAVATAIRRDALGIPRPTEAELHTLFAAHAPLWRLEQATTADLPGAVTLEAPGRPVIDTRQPVEYRHVGWTRFHGAVLLQLSYTLWFPERAAQGPLDIYAGALDAVTWRVTLEADGRVLAYDSIHACGCYYSLFPGPGWRARQDLPPSQEPVFSAHGAPPLGHDDRLQVTLEAGRHYLLAVEAVAAQSVAEAEVLAVKAADTLRSLPLANGSRASLYAPDGLVPKSARLERFLLWPLGVPSAGAMRQEGQHAIAFIGRRHFDDPHLFEALLEARD